MSVTMTGTGIQNDPFVPQDWDDFVTAIGTSGAYVELPIVPIKTKDEHIMSGKLYFDSTGNRIQSPIESELSDYYENGFVLDANAYAPTGIRLDFNGVTLNGNGASIINCYVPNDTCGLRFKNSIIKNINFLNFYSESTDYWGFISPSGGSDRLLTENVQFSGFITRGSFCGTNGMPAFKSTTFSITFCTSASFINKPLNDSDKYYQFCLLDFYGSPSQLFGSTYGNKILNCKMTGTLKGATNSSHPLFPSAGSSTTNVIDMDVTEYQNATFNYDNGNSHNPYIINTDKIASETTHVGITGVTTQQLQDAAYLRNIGFPVGD